MPLYSPEPPSCPPGPLRPGGPGVPTESPLLPSYRQH